MSEAVDVIVIGAGTAGVPAAVEASSLGARVLLLERSDRIGGTLHVSGADLSGAGTRRQLESGVTDDSPQRHFADIVRITGDTVRHDLLRRSVTLAADSIDWLEDNGLRFTDRTPFIMMGHETYATARTCKPLNGGHSIVEVFESLIAQQSATGRLDLQLGATVTDLVTVDGAVVGVEYERGGETHRVDCDHVILACGGYVGNHEMFRERHGRPLTSVGIDTSRGDAITLTEKLGTRVVGDERYLPTVGALLGGDDLDWALWASPRPVLNSSVRSPWEIHVTRAGRRFCSEDHPSLTARQEAVHALDDLTFFVVFDEHALTEAPPIMREWGAQGLRDAANAVPGVLRADSLGELAALAGIDSQGLARTVAEYNVAVSTGRDVHLDRRFMPAPVAQGPFYALEIHGIALDTFAGVDVDAQLRVLGGDNRPVPGLYAVGEAIGAAAMTGSIICSGMLVTPCISLGRAVARSIVECLPVAART
ncbi:FAD-dependent oxidoreductase [Nocardioides sp. W7]|uniref:FAD-dependent oxidoreductase n=1 Tax=Nocardioides sp. W7 TaxID=2931390 RepID=UPI001FD3BCF1|nr:FAD-dependent oxidoreductase [Nocardioides sp. W7]